MVPEGWHPKEIGDLARFQSGGTPSKQQSEFWGGEYPWITGKDLKQHYLTDSIDRLTEKGASVSNLAEEGCTLILVRGMTLLKDFPVGYATRQMAFNQDVKALYPNEGVDGLFLSFLLAGNKNRIRQLVTTAGHGTGRLDTDTFKAFPIVLPSEPEQIRIASILATWDKAIANSERLLANSEKQKKALMQQLLTGKRRLPGFSGKWKAACLGELFKERAETGFTCLPLLSITSDVGVILRDDVGRKDTSNDDKSKYKRICPGDIGYNTMRMWQGVSALSQYEGIVSPAYTILHPTELIHPRFAAYVFKLPRLIHEFYRHSQGLVSDTWNLKYRHFAEIEWAFPDKTEQEALAKVLTAVDSEITGIKTQLSRLMDEKKALMQQLLTGKRRVKVESLKKEAVNG